MARINAHVRIGLVTIASWLLVERFGSMPLHAMFYGVMAGVAAAGALVWWRRTALALTALASAAMAVTFAGFAALTWTAGAERWPYWWLEFSTVALFVAAACLLAEPQLHPGEWRAFREFERDKGVVDVMLLRHIPNQQRPRS